MHGKRSLVTCFVEQSQFQSIQQFNCTLSVGHKLDQLVLVLTAAAQRRQFSNINCCCIGTGEHPSPCTWHILVHAKHSSMCAHLFGIELVINTLPVIQPQRSMMQNENVNEILNTRRRHDEQDYFTKSKCHAVKSVPAIVAYSLSL